MASVAEILSYISTCCDVLASAMTRDQERYAGEVQTVAGHIRYLVRARYDAAVMRARVELPMPTVVGKIASDIPDITLTLSAVKTVASDIDAALDGWIGRLEYVANDGDDAARAGRTALGCACDLCGALGLDTAPCPVCDAGPESMRIMYITKKED